jgi:hypothetical protein
MSLPVSPGYFQNSGYLIPEFWSTKLLFELYEQTTVMDISNTDYEGEIRNVGDTVWIRGLPTISTFLLPKGAQVPTDVNETPRTQLTLDYRRGFNWLIDTEWTTHSGRILGQDCERIDIYPNLIGKAGTTLQGNTAGRISQTIRLGALGAAGNHVGLTTAASGTGNRRNVLDFFTDMRTALAEENVPESDTFVVIPNWMAGMIKRSDLANANYSGDSTSIFRNGQIGTLDGFTVYKSNQLPTATDSSNRVTYIYFGHKRALTMAMNLVDNKVIDSELYVGKKCRGFAVHGHEVIKRAAFGRAIVRPAIAGDT